MYIADRCVDSHGAVCRETAYKEFFIDSIASLRLLDGRRVVDEDRRLAALVGVGGRRVLCV
jgi:hypothetical protein